MPTPVPAPTPPDESARHRACIDAISAYLAMHPMAADSVDGIARWWLAPSVGGAPTRAEVERAVATLVARGILRSVPLADGSVIYLGAHDLASH